MSDKFFFKGRQTPKPKHESYGFNTKRVIKLGTSDNPLSLCVNSVEREEEVKSLLEANQLFANIEINVDQAENITELETLLNKPVTTTFEKTPNRNEPCVCGSGKKYKKCCG